MTDIRLSGSIEAEIRIVIASECVERGNLLLDIGEESLCRKSRLLRWGSGLTPLTPSSQ